MTIDRHLSSSIIRLALLILSLLLSLSVPEGDFFFEESLVTRRSLTAEHES